ADAVHGFRHALEVVEAVRRLVSPPTGHQHQHLAAEFFDGRGPAAGRLNQLLLCTRLGPVTELEQRNHDDAVLGQNALQLSRSLTLPPVVNEAARLSASEPQLRYVADCIRQAGWIIQNVPGEGCMANLGV